MTCLNLENYILTGECPHCSSGDTSGVAGDYDSNCGYYRIVTCNSCSKSWTECYTLTGIEEFEKSEQ